MDLLQMKPKESRLKLNALKQELVLRPINLADEAWLHETYGEKKVIEIFTNGDIKELSRIVFRLLDPESKKLFKKKEVVFITEDGEEMTEELGGVELLRNMIVGWDEKLGVLNALLDNIGANRPETVKKKTVKKSKKTKKA